MRRALRRRIAVVVLAPVGQPQQRWATLPSNVLSVQRTKGSAFAIIIDEVMTQTFGQLGSGSGWTRRAGHGSSAQAFPHRSSAWLAPAKWCGVAVVRGAVHALHSRTSSLHLHSALQVRRGQSFIAHDAACSSLYVRHAWEPTPGLGCLLLLSVSKAEKGRASF